MAADPDDTEVKVLAKCLELAKAANYKAFALDLKVKLAQAEKRQVIGSSVISQHLRDLAQHRWQEELKERDAEEKLRKDAKTKSRAEEVELLKAQAAKELARKGAIQEERAEKKGTRSPFVCT